MPTTKKRYFASFIRTNQEMDGFYDFSCHTFPADANGNSIPDSGMESTDIWLASYEDLDRLHNLLCQVLKRPLR